METNPEEKKIVEAFNQAMLEKISLRHGRYVPLGWKSMDFKRLIWLLEGELEELKHAHDEPLEGNALTERVTALERNKSIQDEAVDVANYAMFIWELSKNL